MVEADSHLKLLSTFILNMYKVAEHIDMKLPPRGGGVRSALPCLKQRLAAPRDCAIALCTVTDADTIPDGIVGASIITAFFFL
jgi:hypothetical protein